MRPGTKHLVALMCVCYMLICTVSYSQNTEFSKENFPNDKEGLKTALRNFKEGNKLYEVGTYMYGSALEFFLQANSFNPNNALLNMLIGNCYLYSNNKANSLPYLEKAYMLDANVDPEIDYMLGKAYHLNMNWDKAIKHYKIYKQKIAGENAPEISEDINRRIIQCNTGIELASKPTRVFIDNVGEEINSPYPDYGSVISADESVMIFTTRRISNEPDQPLTEDRKYFEDIYISYNTNEKWSEAKSIGSPINTDGHDASIGLSPDGQKLLIYIDDNGDGNIYECILKGNVWSKPQKMAKSINSEYHESSASFSPDGRTLYFVSNRPDGNIGKHDIYKVSMGKDGKWGRAENLGPSVNTSGREYSVFMHPDGKTLYFSSEGHNSMGGMDVFKSVYENGKWSPAVNMGYPINSPDDDVDFVISASGKHGYFSSFKNDGVGEKDIYRITFLGAEKHPLLSTEDKLLASNNNAVKESQVAPAVEIATAQLTILKGTITDATTKKPLEGSIELVDNSKNEVIANFTSNSTSGKYLVSLPAGKNYGIAVKADGYLFHSENFDIPGTAAFQEVVKDIALNKLDVGSKIILNNIFFDFNKASLRPESANELERIVQLMNEMPTLKIEISGHTDNVGSAAYNQPLSESRAKSVVDHLINKGIASSRLQYKGYGFSQAIATNDTEEGRQQNRRTEFKIISK